MRCAVFGCKSDDQAKDYKKGDFMFFRFPKELAVRKAWENACCRKDKINTTNARVCSKHFIEEDYARNLQQELLGYTTKNRRLLKPSVVPTVNLPITSLRSDVASTSMASTSRQKRIARRHSSLLVNELLKEDLIQECGAGNSSQEGETSGGCIETIGDGGDGDVAKQKPTQDRGCNTEFDGRDKLISDLTSRITQLEKEAESVKRLFTPKQIQKLQCQKGERIRWTYEDISKAITINAASARTYRLLLKQGYPLPALSTLRSWLKKIKITPGILTPVINIIKLKELNDMEKVCVLSFDEMKIRKVYLYDKVNDNILKPYNYVQVVMLRGLMSNWKQPIFYDYDCKMTKDLLFKIINVVENSGFQIVSIVSDLGGGNRSLHNELGVTIEQTWFLNPKNDQKIYVFADVPHLVKLLRNHFVDSGFILNSKEINKNIIEKLIQITSTTDLRITHKISLSSLNVKGAERQKVKLATKLFSHTISSAITRCGMNGHFGDENWIECAEFFKLVNDWFDCFNSKVPEADSRERVKAFGMALEIQQEIINNMSSVIKNLRVKGKTSLMPFQIGILISNTSLNLLFEDLKKRLNINYILTNKLNQDVLENFFGVIRSKGGLHDHPDALEFKYRLRSYILGKNEGALSANCNVEEDDATDLANSHEYNLMDKCVAGLLNSNVLHADDEDEFKGLEDELSYDGLENLAGFICNKLNEPSSSLAGPSDASYTWVSHVSEGGLRKPSPELMVHMGQLEKIFHDVNKNGILISKNYLKNLLEKSIDVLCTEKIKKIFFRSRMFFRIRQMNEDLKNTACNKKRKLKKTVT